ncbi:MAG TPA: MORN repeat-containing protein, partial [Desulfobacteraceae bacterium]|nr:MORN repeat-containing protein [Desulfobacteraceae bacterium]
MLPKTAIRYDTVRAGTPSKLPPLVNCLPGTRSGLIHCRSCPVLTVRTGRRRSVQTDLNQAANSRDLFVRTPLTEEEVCRVGRIILYLAVLVLLPVSVQAACLKGDCRNGVGRLKSADGRVYAGEFRNGFLWGRGTLVYPNGIK